MITSSVEHAVVRPSSRQENQGPTAEDPDLTIRIVVSRHAGIFTWLAEPNGDVGRRVIAAGETIGTLDRLGEKVPVKSPFKGCLKGHMVVSGERVQSDQPLAWLSLV